MITPKAINRKKRSSISLIKGFIVFLLITIYQRVKLKADSREKRTSHQLNQIVIKISDTLAMS